MYVYIGRTICTVNFNNVLFEYGRANRMARSRVKQAGVLREQGQNETKHGEEEEEEEEEMVIVVVVMVVVVVVMLVVVVVVVEKKRRRRGCTRARVRGERHNDVYLGRLVLANTCSTLVSP